MRNQFIVGSSGDPGLGIFVMKLGFEKSKWFDKIHQEGITIKDSMNTVSASKLSMTIIFFFFRHLGGGGGV